MNPFTAGAIFGACVVGVTWGVSRVPTHGVWSILMAVGLGLLWLGSVGLAFAPSYPRENGATK